MLLIHKQNVEATIEHNNQFVKPLSDRQNAENLHDQVHDKDKLNSSMPAPVKIKFGRPNFDKIFRDAADVGEKEFHVYSCVPDILADHLHYVGYNIGKETGVKFRLNFESFN